MSAFNSLNCLKTKLTPSKQQFTSFMESKHLRWTDTVIAGFKLIQASLVQTNGFPGMQSNTLFFLAQILTLRNFASLYESSLSFFFVVLNISASLTGSARCMLKPMPLSSLVTYEMPKKKGAYLIVAIRRNFNVVDFTTHLDKSFISITVG